MISFISKKHLYFMISSLLLAIPLLVGGASLALASTARTDLSQMNHWQETGPGGPHFHHQVNNQLFQGVNNGGGNSTFVGAGQGNSGNQGINKGLNQVNSANTGNQVSGQRKNIGVQANNQALQSTNNGGGNTIQIGNNQGNSGNQGINKGFNQDNSGNKGNQVNNQGNVIGVQINNQGSQVNNSGSIIQHQINNQGSQVNNNGNIILHQTNYINLFPQLHLHVALIPKLQLSIGLGGN